MKRIVTMLLGAAFLSAAAIIPQSSAATAPLPAKAALPYAITVGALRACGKRDAAWETAATDRILGLMDQVAGPKMHVLMATIPDPNWDAGLDNAFLAERHGAATLVRQNGPSACAALISPRLAYEISKIVNDPHYARATPFFVLPAAVRDAAWGEHAAILANECGARGQTWRAAAHDAVTLAAQKAYGPAKDGVTADEAQAGIDGAMAGADIIGGLQSGGSAHATACKAVLSGRTFQTVDVATKALLAHPLPVPGRPAVAKK